MNCRCFVSVQYHEFEQSCYFCHAPLLYIFVCASPQLLCSCFYFFASCVCRHTQPHARTRCTLQWIWMLLLWRVLAVAGGCCFLCGHEEKEGTVGVRRGSHPCGKVALRVAALLLNAEPTLTRI
ncbi:trans-sialidase [Trypanosoma cruzi]|nr:trans-sialidase [Trypanosoma cruzi]